MLQSSLEGLKATLGAGHPSVLTCQSNIAAALFSQGQHTAALPMYQEVHKQRAAALGPEHHSTLASLIAVASCVAAMGRHQEAAGQLEDALEKCEAALGGGNAVTLTCTSGARSSTFFACSDVSNVLR